MRKALLTTAALAALCVPSAVMAKDIVVGVSWSNFQEERWKTDEAAIKAALAPSGAKYISADAQANPTKQLADVEDLISKGATVLVVLAMDNEAILPAVKKATDEGIPVIAYDRLIESPNALYITFDNVGVGRMMATVIEKAKPAGNYAFIKGDKGDAERQLPVLRHHGSPEAGDRCGQDQERRRDLHRRLEARQRAEGNGADPHQEQQQGRCGRRRERRHGRRRRRRPGRAGPRRRRAGLGPGRRQRRDQPHRAGHADRLDLEGRARPRQGRGRSRRGARPGQEAEPDRRRQAVLGRRRST